MRRSWLALAAGVPLVVVFAVAARSSLRRSESTPEPSIAKTSGIGTAATAPPPPSLVGLDLTKITVTDGVARAPLSAGSSKRMAELTIDPALQRAALETMATHRIPEAAVVLTDVETGRVLVYASHVEKGPLRDLCAEAVAPAASVFKVVTGAALVESGGLSPEERECYSGGEQRLTEKDLVSDPKRDKWCTTLSGAMGRSINTVFARLALRHLKPTALEEWAKTFGFGSSVPFDVRVNPSALRVPEEPLAFARTAAGFWNTTLSPVHAAWISAAVARGGEPVRSSIVRDVVEDGRTIWTAPVSVAQKRVMKPETAQALTTMMESTVADGTSFKAFRDPKGAPFLASIPVAGKTGTLTDAANQRFYTWFTGFAPSHAPALPDGVESPRKVAISVLVVNHPTWTVKANVLAREVLRAYFASQRVPSVAAPQRGVAREAKRARSSDRIAAHQ